MSWNVASVMTTDVVTVGPQTSYKEVVERLRDRRVSAVPVVDAERRVVGIVSEADLLLKEERPDARPGGPLADPHGDAAKALARNAAALMTAPVVTARPEATLTEVARLMHRKHVKRLPVVDPDGRLVGIVSRADLLQVFLRSDESIAHEVREDVLHQTLVIDPMAVTVAVADGVVRLDGEVETRSLALITARLVRAVEGVVAVESRLRWRVDDSHVEVPDHPLALHYSADERP
jgi:CBS-domain-containing membrane protein